MFQTVANYLDNRFVEKQVFRVLNYNFNDKNKTKKFISILKSSLKNNSLNLIHEYIDNTYLGYNTEDERVDSKVNEISSLLNKTTFNRILDFGCGNGNVLSGLSEKLNIDELYGIDKINYLSKNNLEFLHFDKEDNISAADNFFDLSTCLMVLHHTENPKHFINELYRVLSKNGTLIIRETNGYNKEIVMFNVAMEFIFYQVLLKLNVSITHNYFEKSQWKEIFIDSGFKVVKEISQPLEINPFTPFYLVLKK